jgi:hypothetical protein
LGRYELAFTSLIVDTVYTQVSWIRFEIDKPPKSTPGDGSRSTWGDPCVPATGSPILGDFEWFGSPPKLRGWGG